MATYTGSDKRIGYLFTNGGGGDSKIISGYYYNGSFYEDSAHTILITGNVKNIYIDVSTTKMYLYDGSIYDEVGEGTSGSTTLSGLTDVELTAPTDGQALVYDDTSNKWVNGDVQGGGGAVNDGTVGVRIDKSFSAGESKTYSYEELGVTEKGYYILSIATNHAEPYGGWKWYGFLCYSGNTTNNYSYVKQLDSNNINVTMDSVNKTITIQNTNGNWAEAFRIEVLPLHPKIEVEKHAYSTTEQVVGTWIDGKPIYEITVTASVTNPTTNTLINLADVSSLAIDSVCDIRGVAHADNGTSFNRWLSEGINLIFQVNVATGYLVMVQSYSSYGTWDISVTIQYTKTTD